MGGVNAPSPSRRAFLRALVAVAGIGAVAQAIPIPATARRKTDLYPLVFKDQYGMYLLGRPMINPNGVFMGYMDFAVTRKVYFDMYYGKS